MRPVPEPVRRATGATARLRERSLKPEPVYRSTVAHHTDPACDMAHGVLPPSVAPRTLVAVFTSPVARYLLHFAGDLGFRTALVEPDGDRLSGAPAADRVVATLEESIV